MRVAHLIHDDKFFDRTIEAFNSISWLENSFFIFTYSLTTSYRFLRTTKYVRPILMYSKEYNSFLKEKFDVVIVHYLDVEEKLKIIRDLSPDIPIIWLAWGGDFYSKLDFEQLQPITKSYFQEHKKREKQQKNSFYKQIKNNLRQQINCFLARSPEQLYFSAIKRINFCSPVIPNEFNLLKQLPGFHAKQVEFSYLSNFPNMPSDKFEVLGNNIWVGNANTWENNHFEVFEKLCSIGITDKTIICPLSYGENLDITPEILKKGIQLFKHNFIPIKTFMQLEDYNQLQKNCYLAFFNSNRQLAYGNILQALYNGVKIFLSENNPIYHYLIAQNCEIYSFPNELTLDEISKPLSKEKQMNNRTFICKEYNNNREIEKIEKMLKNIS